jgi:hypothetical protein
VLAWCALCGWFAFVGSQRVPLLSMADLGFHELGHLVTYILPINEVLTAAMGSIMQIAVPLALAAYFGWYRRDPLPMVGCLAWAATNFQDVSVYMADAPFQRLQLIGGEHDWAFVLGPDGFDRLQQAEHYASIVRGVGVLVLLTAICLGVAGCARAMSAPRDARSEPRLSRPAAIPDAARGTMPDDRFPTTSRTPSSDPDHRSTHW